MKISRRFSAVERRDILEKSQECLWTANGRPGLDYLSGRGLSEHIIRQFKLGYIPKFVKHQLSGRVIIPIFDPSGNLISISSRRILEEDDFLPVYWHESYEKSWYLYGIDQAKTSMRKWRFAVIVEGQFDVLQLHNHGMTNTVGLCSTNLSSMQFAAIQRYCEEIVILLDQDENKSGQKGVEKILEHKRQVERDAMAPRVELKIAPAYFGENTDPDSFIKTNGIDKLKTIIRTVVKQMRSKYVE